MRPDPQPWTRDERLALAREICARLRDVHGDALHAVGVYGSTARGTDGPYSDLEMWCVVSELPVVGDRGAGGSDRGDHYAHEWVHGPWKAEVDVYTAEALLAEAARVEGDWSLTHGSFEVVLALYDPHGYFARLRAAAVSASPGTFHETLREVIVGELYEDVAKARNAMAMGHATALPQIAFWIATYGAFAIGLANRHRFTTATRRFEEARTLPNRPLGYDRLADLVMAGTLSNAHEVASAIERFWADLVPWAERQGITIAEPRRLPF